jgi:hypothetical protein
MVCEKVVVFSVLDLSSVHLILPSNRREEDQTERWRTCVAFVGRHRHYLLLFPYLYSLTHSLTLTLPDQVDFVVSLFVTVVF